MRGVWKTVVAGALLSGFVGGGSALAAEPVGLIYDTDICGDCDDVLALGMIHAMQSRGDCRLLAVTISARNDKVAPFVSAVNTFYGRGGVPVGEVGDGGVALESKYLKLVDQKDDGAFRYPHDASKARAAVDLLRETLAAQPDQSVVIAQVGFSTNLARLLETKADQHSPLSGEELVKAKVRLLSMMAGSFEPIDGNNRFLEYNVVKDVPSCGKLVKNWPTDVVFSGYEIGISLPYPATSIERDFGYVKHHPLAEAYILYNPPPHNRPTWDLTSVLYAVHPDRGYFDLSAPGDVVVEDDGFTRYNESPNGRRRYLILRDDAQKARALEALVQLSSQPPDAREGDRP